jgi:hypothetical protein
MKIFDSWVYRWSVGIVYYITMMFALVEVPPTVTMMTVLVVLLLTNIVVVAYVFYEVNEYLTKGDSRRLVAAVARAASIVTIAAMSLIGIAVIRIAQLAAAAK